MVDKFICSQCGNCCKVFESEDDEKAPFFESEFELILENLSLPIMDWELDIFKAQGKEDKIVPGKVIYDLATDQTIVIHYTIKGNPCPLLRDNLCISHTNKPIVCNLFPCKMRLNPDTKHFTIDTFKVCPAELPRPELFEMIGLRKDGKPSMIKPHSLMKNAYERYGDMYIYNFIYDIIVKSMSGFIANMIIKGKLRPAREGYNIKDLQRRISKSKTIGFSEYYEQHTGEKIQDFIGKASQDLKKTILED